MLDEQCQTWTRVFVFIVDREIRIQVMPASSVTKPTRLLLSLATVRGNVACKFNMSPFLAHLQICTRQSQPVMSI
jgi:hypothetical protein